MCSNASGWAKLAFGVLLVGVVLHVVGWATNKWMTYETENGVIKNDIGLWRQELCNSGTCEDSTVDSSFVTDEFNAVRGVETATFCLSVFVLILLLIYLCADIARRQRIAGAIMFLCYVAGICSFIGMIIFIIKVPSPYVISWSLGLTVIAMTLILIAGTLMIPDTFEPDYGDDYYNEDDYFNTARRRDVVSPMSIGGRGPRRGDPKAISWNNNYPPADGNRWRSY